MKKRIFIVLLILLIFSCKKESNDSKTSATVKRYKTRPVDGNTYMILGNINGLKGWIIKYDNGIIRGGDVLSMEGMKKLKDRGIKTIFSVSPTNTERFLATEFDINLIDMEYQKDPGMTNNVIEKFINGMKNNPGKYYVHCIGGANRAGALMSPLKKHLFHDNFVNFLPQMLIYASKFRFSAAKFPRSPEKSCFFRELINSCSQSVKRRLEF